MEQENRPHIFLGRQHHFKHAFHIASNDVVFATAADGRVYAFDAKSGKKLWSDKASSSAEGGLAIGGQTLLVRVGTPGSEPGPELIAYRLGGHSPGGGV